MKRDPTEVECPMTSERRLASGGAIEIQPHRADHKYLVLTPRKRSPGESGTSPGETKANNLLQPKEERIMAKEAWTATCEALRVQLRPAAPNPGGGAKAASHSQGESTATHSWDEFGPLPSEFGTLPGETKNNLLKPKEERIIEEEVWTAVCEALKVRLRLAAYNTWIAPARLVDVQGR